MVFKLNFFLGLHRRWEIFSVVCSSTILLQECGGNFSECIYISCGGALTVMEKVVLAVQVEWAVATHVIFGSALSLIVPRALLNSCWGQLGHE